MTPIKYIILVVIGYIVCLYIDKHLLHLDPTEGMYILALWSVFIFAPLFSKRLAKWIGIFDPDW